MSEDLGVAPGGQIRPLGKYILIALGVVTVTILIVAIMTQGLNYSIPSDADSGRSRIDLDALHRIPSEISPTPVPVHAVFPDMGQNMPAPTPAPTPQRQKSALELWREMEAMKAREAPVMFPGFGDKDRSVQEIASKATGDLSHYLPAASPYTIMEGAHIAASLISGVNSDYPGPITAQVLQAVYDTATGRYLLIPPGARLVGAFESPSGPVQERIAIKWHRIIFPDTSSFDLPDAPSTDDRGFAGMSGDVNHHYGSILGAALLSSVLSIGPALGSVLTFNSAATSPYGGGVYQTQPEQQLGMMAATTAGSRASSTADRFLGPRLNRSPTITIFPGAVIDVFCNKDLILPGAYHENAGISPVIVQR